jgi:hypothetical protein
MVQLINDIMKQTAELNEMQQSIFQRQREINALDLVVTNKRMEETLKVIKMSEDELFKKELSNELKRKNKVDEIMNKEYSEILGQLESHQTRMELEQHLFTMKNRVHQASLTIARLISSQ